MGMGCVNINHMGMGCVNINRMSIRCVNINHMEMGCGVQVLDVGIPLLFQGPCEERGPAHCDAFPA